MIWLGPAAVALGLIIIWITLYIDDRRVGRSGLGMARDSAWTKFFLMVGFALVVGGLFFVVALGIWSSLR